MEARVVIDRKGKIVSAVYRSKAVTPELEGRPMPNMGPVPEKGQTVVELAVPDEYALYPVVELEERLAADIETRMAKRGK